MTTKYGRTTLVADSRPRLGDVDTRGIDGRTHTPDPEAVARLLAAEARARLAREQSEQRKRQQLAALRASKRRRKSAQRPAPTPAPAEPEPEPEPKGVEPMTETTLTDAQLGEMHDRYMRGTSIKALAAEAGMPWQALMSAFSSNGLPKRPPLTTGKKAKKTAIHIPPPGIIEKPKTADIHANDAQRAAQIAAKRAQPAQHNPRPTVAETAVPTSPAVTETAVTPATSNAATPNVATGLERLAAIRDLVRDIEAAGAEVSVSFTFDLQVRFER